MARRMSLFAVLVVLALAAAGYGALHYMTAVPGKPHRGALPPLTAEEAALAASLKRHIATIAAREHNVAHYDELEKVARYIETALGSLGYAVGRQEFLTDGKTVRNIDVAVELARLLRDLDAVAAKRIRLALFVNEEPPYFRTEAMGSLHYARALARRNERVVAMYSLETIGFYSSEPGSQVYPVPFGLIFPDRGDFIAFVGMMGSRPLVRETMRSFRAHTAFPTIGGVAPGFVPGIAWSDHWAFAEHGFPAVMITDTAPFRYPHYHRSSDTPDKVDAENVARVVKGIERVIRDFSR